MPIIKVNSIPALGGQQTPKMYVDQAISVGVGQSSLLNLDLDEKLRLDEQDSTVLNSALTLAKPKIELAAKKYVGKKFNVPSIKKTAHVDFNNKILDNVTFVKVNRRPAVEEHLTAKSFVEKAIF